MFCSNCGKQAVLGQAVCANCGAALAVPGVPPAYAANPPQAAYPVYPAQAGYPVTPSNPGYPGYAVPSRVARHMQILGILWVIRGILSLLGWLIALPFVTGSFSRFGNHGLGPWGSVFHGAPFWVPMVTAFVVVHVALSLATGYALLTRQPWGRVLAIIAAILALLSIPFGTALGIYTLIILLPANAAAEYAAISPRRW